MKRGTVIEIVTFMTLAVIPYESRSDERYPPVQRVIQETNTCWAATSLALINRYNIWPFEGGASDNSGLCAIIDWAKDYDDCCSSWDPMPDHCHATAQYDGPHDVLEHWGISSTYRDRALTEAECKTEIANGRPVIVQWNWVGTNNGHSILVTGDNEYTNPPEYLLMYMNPASSSLTGGYWTRDYDWVVDNDGDAQHHSWEATVEADENPSSEVWLRHTKVGDDYVYETSGDMYSFDFLIDGDCYVDMIAGTHIGITTQDTGWTYNDGSFHVDSGTVSRYRAMIQ
jgi:hypothetical protein